jgi:hypothetical protein
MFVRLPFVLIWILLLSSCTDLNRPERLRKIDILQGEISEMEKVISEDQLDTLELLKDLNAIHQWAFEIEDTIDLELMYQLDSVRSITSDLQDRNALRRYLISALELKSSRLKELENDIVNDYGSRAQYDKYIRSEEKFMDSLQDRFMRFDQLNQSLRNKYPKFLEEFRRTFGIDSLHTEQYLLDSAS